MLGPYAERAMLAPPGLEGKVTEVLGMLIAGSARDAAVGDLYRIESRDDEIIAEVVALRGNDALLVPYGNLSGVRVGDRMVPQGGASAIDVSDAMLGRMINVMGKPMDGGPALPRGTRRLVYGEPLAPAERAMVDQRLPLGVRCLDAFVPAARGQRLGIFAGPGVGKSVLMGMIARSAQADVTVMGLVGERGREVGHFATQILGPEGMQRSVLVVATSDRPPSERVRAAFVATTIAEYFRDQGKSVLLFVDSLTRFAMAQREVGLAIGEPPTTKGYPPSTFAMMPRLLERAAPDLHGGSITGIYTVLVEGDDMTDPVGDAAKGLLDGHITLSRSLANRGHYPAVDVLQSLSRVDTEVSSNEELQAARKVRGWLAQLEDSKDLVSVGAYKPGSDPLLDQALKKGPLIDRFLQQNIHEIANPVETRNTLLALGR
jgi:flagellum-specific ATP synthase